MIICNFRIKKTKEPCIVIPLLERPQGKQLLFFPDHVSHCAAEYLPLVLNVLSFHWFNCLWFVTASLKLWCINVVDVVFGTSYIFIIPGPWQGPSSSQVGQCSCLQTSLASSFWPLKSFSTATSLRPWPLIASLPSSKTIPPQYPQTKV